VVRGYEDNTKLSGIVSFQGRGRTMDCQSETSNLLSLAEESLSSFMEDLA